ncbi:hypothetical protein Ancab_013821 [Ancistrocladus abbreviatus]
MACSNSTCQSGCYNTEDDDVSLTKQEASISNGHRVNSDDPDRQTICAKCKVNEAVAGGAGGGEDGRFCVDCFRSSLFGKFRFAVTSNGMISPSDKVLVAFSGGASSRVALQFVHEMQSKAQKNLDASRDKSLPVFGVGVVFIDESSACAVPDNKLNNAIEHMQSIVSSLAPPTKDLHIFPIEHIYSSDSGDVRDKLHELLNAVKDDTGREDLLVHMRMLSLQKIAIENGYTKLVLGTCTSRIARHVISATIKGQGYSLPADIQYVDARWPIPVMLPLRDCLAQELMMLCQLDGLKTVEVVTGLSSGINALASSFVTLLQEENPSRECTIMRTAGKLTPFDFNRLPGIDDSKAHSASQRRQKKYNLKVDESTPPESFCQLCYSPLNRSDSPNYGSFATGSLPDCFKASCCSSCRFQILPPDFSGQFYALLPHQIISRAEVAGSFNHKCLVEQIQDFLLSDGED